MKVIEWNDILSTSVTHVSSKRKLRPSNTHNKRHYVYCSDRDEMESKQLCLQCCLHISFDSLVQLIGYRGKSNSKSTDDWFICYDAGLETEDAWDTVRHAMARTHRLEYIWGLYVDRKYVWYTFKDEWHYHQKIFQLYKRHYGHLGNNYDALLSLHHLLP